MHGHSITRASGLTLLELLVTIALVSLLTSIALPAYQGMQDAGNVQTAIGDIRSIEDAIFRYQLTHNNALPPGLNNIGKQNMTDPWNHPYQYKIIPDDLHGVSGLRRDRNLLPINSDFDLYSKGADGNSADNISAQKSLDDIIRANDGTYIGLASKY